MDDVFDETGDELNENKNEYKKIMENIEKEGFIDGIEKGKQNKVQSGFDKGFELAFKYFEKINLLKGILSVASFKQKHKSKFLEETLENLNSLEEEIKEKLIQNLKDVDLEFYNEKINLMIKQLEESNVIKNSKDYFD